MEAIYENGMEYLLVDLKDLLRVRGFAIAFNLFLRPNALNAGGVSGLAMVFVKVTGLGLVGTVTTILNLPLFILGGMKIGKRFFFGSLVGMLASSVFVDLFAFIPAPETEPLLGALYGGVLSGIGLGIVLVVGASTGGSDILVRLLKRRFPDMALGTIHIAFDMIVVTLTGLAYWDISKALYSGVAIFITGQVIDAVVYRFDYSKVAIIISREYEAVAKTIGQELQRGATYLNGQGVYSGNDTKVILTAVKKHQLSDLKRIVVEIDPNAFIIVQEAHQVLGDGFLRYSEDSL